MQKQHTVMVILEAKPGKETELESALISVAKQSRSEDSNVDYRVHKSIDNPQQFILYENWINQELHQQQFEKPYIQELGSNLQSVLAKPYQAYMANEIELS